jgi:DNA-binding LacI/PurR family transcriptional regulator
MPREIVESVTRAGRRVATLRDVAGEAGVSVATASKALRGIGRMRERIRTTARQLGFRPNALQPVAKSQLHRRLADQRHL